MDLHDRLITYSPAEELANRLTHGFAALLSLPAMAVLVVAAARTGDPYRIVSGTVFAFSLSAFYVISTVYHSVQDPRRRYLFRILDHAGIYLVIAGTYTPLTLVTLRAGHGWTLFGVVWGLAVAGALFKSFMTHRLRFLAPVFYIALGWLVVVDLDGVLTALDPRGFAWLLAGGIVYTVGILFYAVDRIPHHHAIWHLFVLAGSACHYLAVLWYVIPLP